MARKAKQVHQEKVTPVLGEFMDVGSVTVSVTRLGRTKDYSGELFYSAVAERNVMVCRVHDYEGNGENQVDNGRIIVQLANSKKLKALKGEYSVIAVEDWKALKLSDYIPYEAKRGEKDTENTEDTENAAVIVTTANVQEIVTALMAGKV